MELQDETNQSSRKRRGRGTKWLIILAVCLGLYAVIGFFIAPLILHSKLESALTEQLGHPVSIGDVRLNPFALSLTVRDLAISDYDQSPLVGFEELYVNVELVSLIKRTLTFFEITLTYPYAVARVRKDGSFNLADLRPSAPAPEAPPETATPAPPDSAEDQALPGVIIEVLHIDRGILEFHDDSKPTPFTAEIVPITFALLNFTTKPEALDAHDLNFTAQIGPGEGIEWRGSLYLQPLRSEGTVILTKLNAPTLWAYMKDLVNFEITDGVIDIQASYQVRSDPDVFQASVEDAEVRVTNFALGEKDADLPLIAIPELTVDGIHVDLPAREARIAAVRSNHARITGWLDEQRRSNFQALFASTGRKPAPDPEPSPDTTSAPESAPWHVKIDEVSIDEYSITIEDRKPSPPVRVALNPLNIKLANVSSQLDAKVGLDFFARINEAGTVTATGGFTAQPATADLDLDISKIALAPFQPYLDPIAQLQLKSGAASLKGHLSYQAKSGKQSKIKYAGRVAVEDLLTQDKLLNKDFLKWDELALNGLNVEIDPTKVTIAEIVAKEPYLRFIIGQDRSTNVQQIFAKTDSPPETPGGSGGSSSQAAPTEASSQAVLPVQIGAIRLVDASTHFADFSLRPVIDTGIFGLNGAIKGLSSKELSRANVSIEGKVDKYAPVSIKGKINPLTGDKFTDLGVSFKNVELTTVSPYSTKFAGYPIKKGKVSVDLQYKLSKQVLEAENKVVIEQLTLGDKVESPEATSLPVKLAIALLKDRNGVIDIDLPVRGDLNDPDFKYGSVLLGVLVNLVTKAATSPFSLVAGLVGGNDQELSVLEFPVGMATLPPASEEKLTSLAKALKERPALQLEISGAADQHADRAALAELVLHRELLALKATQSRSDAKPAPEHDNFAGLPETEQLELIRTLYLRKYGRLPDSPQPKTGQSEKPALVSILTLKERLLEDVPVEESEILRLGRERAQRIQEYLITQGGIPPERIFLLEVKLDAKAADGQVASHLNLNAT